MRSQTPNRSGSSVCGSGPRFSAANSPSLAKRGRGLPSRSKSPSPAPPPTLHPSMRILIADDHAVVRHGLRQILADDFKRAVFGEAGTGQEALNKVWNEKWDVVVLDITMPGRGGLEVLKEIKKSCPKLPVLVLSMHPEDQFAVRVLKAGASGYMTKESAPEELVGAIKKVVGGGRHISTSLGELMAAYISVDAKRPPHETLSNREFQVMRRSEEHTSELQSQSNLVCRLLLEKKKKSLTHM